MTQQDTRGLCVNCGTNLNESSHCARIAELERELDDAVRTEQARVAKLIGERDEALAVIEEVRARLTQLGDPLEPPVGWDYWLGDLEALCSSVLDGEGS